MTDPLLQRAAADHPWREPVRGGHPSADWAAQPGHEQIRAMLAGGTPEPPLARLLGMRLVQFGDGTATFTMPITGWLCAGDGQVPLGPLAIPADAAMACALITGLPAYTGLTTAELSLRQVRPAVPGTTLRAHARRLSGAADAPAALAEVTLTDDGGRLIAHGGSLCVTLPALGAPDVVAPSEPAEPDGPDPWERPAPPAAAGPPPLERLTGLRTTTTARGEATAVLPATRWLCAPPPGRVQGGAVAALAEAAITSAIRSETRRGGAAPVPVEVKLNFLRPLASDGREAGATGRLIHSGRRISVASAEVVDAGGRAVAVATGSAVAERAGT